MKALTLCALLVPLAALADSPFDGTWLFSEESSSVSGEPVQDLPRQGRLGERMRLRPIRIKADGTDQPVKGHDYFDTMSVKETGPSSADFTTKMGGKVMATNAFTVSPDGKTLTLKWSDMSGTEPVTGESTYQREGAAPEGGERRLRHLAPSEAPVRVGERPDGDAQVHRRRAEYELANRCELHREVRRQGRPNRRRPGGTTASLKRVNNHTIVETDKRHGKVVEVDHMTVRTERA